MADYKDYYKILGVDKNSSEQEIKKAFRRLSMRYHPDKQQDKSEAEKKEAEEKFKEVAEAYSVLSDTQKKQQYDTFGTVDGGFGGMNIDPDDIFASFFGRRGFSGFGNFGDFNVHKQQVFKGADKVLKVNVTLKEIYNNVSKDITYTVKRPCATCNGKGSKSGKIETCSHCNGSGQIRERQQFGIGMITESITTCPYCNGTGKIVVDKCPTCGGTGLADTKETIRINVPTIDKVLQQSFRHKGGGHSCQNGLGANGDLNFSFSIIDEEGYELDNDNAINIIKTVNVSVIDCLLGCVISVDHLDGKKYNITINECTGDGQLYRIRGKGFKFNNYYGDLYVKIKQVMPKSLSEEDKKTLNKLKKSKTFKF